MPTTTYIHKYQIGQLVFFKSPENKPIGALVQSINFFKDNTFGSFFYYKLARPDMLFIDEPFEEHELFNTAEELLADK